MRTAAILNTIRSANSITPQKERMAPQAGWMIKRQRRASSLCLHIYLTATYGFRRQEICGLKWSAIDFNDQSSGLYGSLTVCHTVTKIGGKSVKADKTKTTASLRTLPLTKKMSIYLKKLYASQRQSKLLLKTGYHDNDYVCKWPDGREIDPDYITHTWKQQLEIFGMPHIRFHDLRHSCASLLVKMKFSLKDVQEWLGHSNIRSTEIYVHLYNAKQDVAIQMDKILEFGCDDDTSCDQQTSGEIVA